MAFAGAPQATESLERIPPQNVEAEQAVLGSLLLDNEAIYRVIEFLSPEDFYREAHRRIYQAILDLTGRTEPADLVTVTDHFKGEGGVEAVGGSAYLSSLVDRVATAANVTAYANIIREKSLLRRLIAASTEIIAEGYATNLPVDEFLDQAEKAIFDIAQRKIKQHFFKISDVVRDSFKLIEQLYERKELVTGVPTGFVDLDRMTAGLQPSELVIIAGRPSMGKTALALNIAFNAALLRKIPVAIFSLEMSKEQLVQRLLCTEARVDGSKLRSGYLSKEDWERLTQAAGKLSETSLFIDDTPALNILAMRAKARRLQREHGLGLIVVDYMQLMKGPGRPESREREISEISQSLKALAKELSIPVLALSQLNRMVENRRPPIPQLADLRESGAIEQDADVIAFIYREELYDKETLNKGVAEIHIGKQRNGPIGMLRLAFHGAYTRFDNLAHETPPSQEAPLS